MTVKAPVKRDYKCAKCNRRLKVGRWVYSHATKARYCLPGQGCFK